MCWVILVDLEVVSLEKEFGKWRWCFFFEINLFEGGEKGLIGSLLIFNISKVKEFLCKFYMRINLIIVYVLSYFCSFRGS